MTVSTTPPLTTTPPTCSSLNGSPARRSVASGDTLRRSQRGNFYRHSVKDHRRDQVSAVTEAAAASMHPWQLLLLISFCACAWYLSTSLRFRTYLIRIHKYIRTHTRMSVGLYLGYLLDYTLLIIYCVYNRIDQYKALSPPPLPSTTCWQEILKSNKTWQLPTRGSVFNSEVKLNK